MRSAATFYTIRGKDTNKIPPGVMCEFKFIVLKDHV